jgi:serpin B
MKEKSFFSLLILVAFFAVSCENSLESQQKLEPAQPIEMPAALALRTAQGNEFAFDLFYKILQTTDDKNVFISPLSVDFALGMTLNGANGVTEQEMKNVLKHSGLTNTQINEYYQIMLNALPAVDPATKLNIANSIWCHEGFPFHQSFLDVNAKYFDAEIANLDFSSPTALKTINDWCARATNNLIKEPLDEISPLAVMYLINAIYFKGIWTTQFDKKNTAKATFFAENGSQNQVDMMHIPENGFPFYADENAQYLDMAYGNGAFSMTVILPHEGKTLQDVTDNLSTDYFNNIVKDRLQERNVRVFFPRFKMEYEIELQDDVLPALGMLSAFDPEIADFSGMSNKLPLYINRVIHSTFVEVNEEGTEAAAVTIVEMDYLFSNGGGLVTFRADRPFMFVIRENSTGAILFMGKMGDI